MMHMHMHIRVHMHRWVLGHPVCIFQNMMHMHMHIRMHTSTRRWVSCIVRHELG